MIEIQKNRLERVGLWLEEWNGQKLCHIRVKATGGEGDEQRFTKKGVAFQASKIREFIDALTKLEEEAKAKGWVSP